MNEVSSHPMPSSSSPWSVHGFDGQEHIHLGNINLGDLAGSEMQNKAGPDMARRTATQSTGSGGGGGSGSGREKPKEVSKINLSLTPSSLGSSRLFGKECQAIIVATLGHTDAGIPGGDCSPEDPAGKKRVAGKVTLEEEQQQKEGCVSQAEYHEWPVIEIWVTKEEDDNNNHHPPQSILESALDKNMENYLQEQKEWLEEEKVAIQVVCI
ncbi:hypothetical protein GH733_005870 [Mirounga leonina]|nr:hypothetical protein GH733_005870 [Mirounga leonina]